MRLLSTGPYKSGHEKLELIEEFGRDIPDYAILSHTWGSDEVLYDHIRDGTAHTRQAYGKVVNAMQQAASDGFAYIWIDSCCIDKSSSAELSEALNSMYAWYQRSDACYAFLEDVPPKDSEHFSSAFAESRWFTRGWTLQELLAPMYIVFFGQDQHGTWTLLGDGVALQAEISMITSIDEAYLSGRRHVHDASIAKRMCWAASRETKREEDVAYCLLGLFSINMPMLYGEGSRAFLRLQEEIIKRSDDQSIFAWTEDPESEGSRNINAQPTAVNAGWSIPQWMTGRSKQNAATTAAEHGLLADSPSAFARSRNFVPCRIVRKQQTSYQMSNRGLGINLLVIRYNSGNLCRALLECRDESRTDNKFLGVYLKRTDTGSNQYARVRCEKLLQDLAPADCSRIDLFVRQAVDSQLNDGPTQRVLLGDLRCPVDSYATTQILHLRVLDDRKLETRKMYPRVRSEGRHETSVSQPTVLRLRSASGQLVQQHVAAVSLVRQSDRKRLLILMGISGQLQLSFAINPPHLQEVQVEDLAWKHFEPTVGQPALRATTNDGDHVKTTVQTRIEHGRKTVIIDLDIWPCISPCSENRCFHSPRTDVSCVDMWDGEWDEKLA